MRKKYFNQYDAYIQTDNIEVNFQRLFEDVKDEMSDDPRPEWEARDEFYVTVRKIETSFTSEKSEVCTVLFKNRKVVKELSFFCDKNTANMIWKLAKKYDNFEICTQSTLMCNK